MLAVFSIDMQVEEQHKLKAHIKDLADENKDLSTSLHEKTAHLRQSQTEVSPQL